MKKITIWVSLLVSSLLYAQSQLLYKFDFGKYPDGDALTTLQKEGFVFYLSAKKLHLRFKNKRLELETDEAKAGLFGIMLKDPLQNVTKVKIVWGVERFPQKANWEKGNNRLALGAIIVLGTKEFPSGAPRFIAPPSPYFIAPFIGEKEQKGKMYLGKLYKKGGRYYCISNDKGVITTEFDLYKKFRENFNDELPPVTAFAFQMNTKNTHGGAKAFIKSISFYTDKNPEATK